MSNMANLWGIFPSWIFGGGDSGVERALIPIIVEKWVILGLPHYKQLNFRGGSDWLGATAATLIGITHAGDKNNVALKSRVLPHDELPLVSSRKHQFCVVLNYWYYATWSLAKWWDVSICFQKLREL